MKKPVHHFKGLNPLREPVKKSEITFPTPYSCHIEHEYKVKGKNLADRFIRLRHGENEP